MPLLDEELTYAVIGCFLRVFNRLGSGFLENVYVGALVIELQKLGLHVEREVPIAIHYESRIVGTYSVDLLVERRLVLEVKSGHGPPGQFEKQLRNYLTASDLQLGLLLIFGDRPAHKRVIHSDRFKSFKKAPRSFPLIPSESAEPAEPGRMQASEPRLLEAPEPGGPEATESGAG